MTAPARHDSSRAGRAIANYSTGEYAVYCLDCTEIVRPHRLNFAINNRPHVVAAARGWKRRKGEGWRCPSCSARRAAKQ